MDAQDQRDYALYLKSCIEVTTCAVKDVTADQIEQSRDKVIFCLAASAMAGGGAFLTPGELTTSLARYQGWT